MKGDALPEGSRLATLAPPLPWERQTGDDGKQETDRAYRAFCVYLELERRSLKAAAALYYHGDAETEPKPSQVNQLKGWSSRWSWVDRARAYDDDQAIVRLEARKRAIQRMEDEQAAQATEMENRIASSILRDLERADEAEEILAAREAYDRTGEVPDGAPEGVADLTDVQLKGYRDSRISLHQRRLMWEASGRVRRRALGEPETIEEQSSYYEPDYAIPGPEQHLCGG